MNLMTIGLTTSGLESHRPALLWSQQMFVRLLAFVSFAGFCSAADIYITPEGSGKKDGASWENALSQDSLAQAVNDTMKPGDRLLMGSGAYEAATLTITKGGAEGLPKIIEGVDRGAGLPVFEGAWSVDAPTKGQTAIQIAPGVSHLTFQNLRVKGYNTGIHAPPVKSAAVRSHLVFDNVDMEQFRYGFYLSDCDDLQMTGCDLKRYSKHAFRFNEGCDRITVRRCSADCSAGDVQWETKTELLPFGFTINDGGAPNSKFLFEDCLARNNMKSNQTSRYPNGDGFVVEGNTTDVTFVRCRSIRNQDGGYDLKVPDVKLTDCVAIGNKRGFRVWTTGNLVNCFAGWDITGLWNNGGPLTATRCTFYGATGAAVMTDDQATQPITLDNCIITLGGSGEKSRPTNGRVVLNGSVVSGPGQPDRDPDFVRPDPSWNGLGEAMNSRAYSGKGYRGTLQENPATP